MLVSDPERYSPPHVKIAKIKVQLTNSRCVLSQWQSELKPHHKKIGPVPEVDHTAM